MTDIVVGIDPGDIHNGYCSLDGETGEIRGRNTIGYQEMIAFVGAWPQFEKATGHRIFACIEVFQLYPATMHAQAWSDFPVVKLIGVLEHLMAEQNRPYRMGRPPDINRFFKKRRVPSSIRNSGDEKHQHSAYRLAEYYRVMYLPEAIEAAQQS